jgi:hypothetical protein
LFLETEVQICAILLKNSEWVTCKLEKKVGVERVKMQKQWSTGMTFLYGSNDKSTKLPVVVKHV